MKFAVVVFAWVISLNSQAGELKLELYGKQLTGQALIVAVFNTEVGFTSGDQPVRTIIVNATSYSTTFLIQNLPSGKYAIAAFSDSNQNGKLDKNSVGIPTELYGFSNNVRGRVGPPSFAEAAFVLGEDAVSQSIHLQ